MFTVFNLIFRSLFSSWAELATGVNTGCGGNGDARTRYLEDLQHSFFQHHQCGILPELNKNGHFHAQSLEKDIIKATVLIRCNSLLRGHSAVRLEIPQYLIKLLNENILPLIPKRGSISASGDLAPLSYVGGLLEGSPEIYVWVDDGDRAKCRVKSAKDALEQIGLAPLRMRAKEGLSIVNGTSVSTAAAVLVIHDSHNLALLSQLLTAMGTEALLGTVDNFDSFISRCRPHPGQAEVAENIWSFLQGSKLSYRRDSKTVGLVQDRYAVRTAPQWIGPHIEDLLLAERQVNVELNSSTDNPLIDEAQSRIHYGGGTFKQHPLLQLWKRHGRL
ncbi:aromatic amino acid ammonia-lyase [Aspergillus tanneri]|uniref:Phenylalanine ammonia-lyase n=1 Tax=Aspergillus tanneri TaxID=1220188 RepID=A0A5M9MY60_9EURO|nr:uncharacterized protein ATNIH1004_002983 [Aspergillus tanneri]KAA8650300.1 hypothetical protein ATNIH1004_002983 [Aspergillus tanneri]